VLRHCTIGIEIELGVTTIGYSGHPWLPNAVRKHWRQVSQSPDVKQCSSATSLPPQLHAPRRQLGDMREFRAAAGDYTPNGSSYSTAQRGTCQQHLSFPLQSFAPLSLALVAEGVKLQQRVACLKLASLLFEPGWACLFFRTSVAVTECLRHWPKPNRFLAVDPSKYSHRPRLQNYIRQCRGYA
jgi:hypothetical protein